MTNKQRQLCNSLVLLISFLLIGCGGGAATADNAKEPESSLSPNTPDNSQELKSADRYPIIEIWEELDGSVPIRGKSLYFRMYDDGVVEFEYLVRKENTSPSPRYIYSIERTPPAKLPEEQAVKLRALVDEITKSKDIKPEYKPVALTLDVLTKLTILLNQNGTANKKVIINDAGYDVIDPKFEKIFPRSLIDLFKEIHLMRREQEKQTESTS